MQPSYDPVRDVDKYHFTLLDPFGDNRDTEDNDDRNMCWTASAANALTYAGWAVVRPEYGFDGPPQWEAYHDFMAAYRDLPSFPSIAFKSYLDWYHDIDYDEIDPNTNQHPYVVRHTSSLKSNLMTLLDDGWGTALGIYYRIGDNVLGGHAITCWGYSDELELDPDDSTDDYDVLETYITDSDDFDPTDYMRQGGTLNDALYESYVRNNVELQTVRLALISGYYYLRGHSYSGYTFELIEAIKPNPDAPQTSYFIIDDQIQWNAGVSPMWNGTLIELGDGSDKETYYYDTKAKKGFAYTIEGNLVKSPSGDGIPDKFSFTSGGESFTQFKNQLYQVQIEGKTSETFSLVDGRTFFYMADSSEENISLEPVSGLTEITIPATWTDNDPLPSIGNDEFALLVEAAQEEVDLPPMEPDPELYVTNANPIAVIDGPDQADEGDTVSLDANGSIDLDGEITSYEWDLDDDSNFDDATGPTASVTFDDDGTYTVALRVTDDDGETNVATKIITVFNVAPTVNLTANPEIVECNIDEVTITATVTDPGSADTHSIIWDFGDGPEQIDEWEAHHTYDGCGEFIVTTLVKDDDGATGSDKMIITVVDTTPPDVAVVFPESGQAVQDGITLTATASDNCGLGTVRLYVREADGASGTPVGFEDLPTVLDGDQWKADFDSTLLDDGYYVALARAEDASGNESWSEPVPFSIRNWAVLELRPASKANKAGRTMPVKFSLKIAESVDPAKPFVYNEDLEIRICETDNSAVILQTSAFGDSSRDYRIDSSGELYITNFKTKKQPAHYTVEIIRPNHNDFLVGSFSFETVK